MGMRAGAQYSQIAYDDVVKASAQLEALGAFSGEPGSPPYRAGSPVFEIAPTRFPPRYSRRAVTPHFPGMRAAMMNVPDEVLDRIPTFFTIHDEPWLSDTLNHVIVTKRELGRIALVCHRWADLIQRTIFQEITLWSYEDVETLLRLIPPQKVWYIENILIPNSCRGIYDRFWVHIISRLLPEFGNVRYLYLPHASTTHIEDIEFDGRYVRRICHKAIEKGRVSTYVPRRLFIRRDGASSRFVVHRSGNVVSKDDMSEDNVLGPSSSRHYPREDNSTRRSVTAADIPVDLYEHILDFLATPVHEDRMRSNQGILSRVVATKRELGRIALVCREWAKLILPKVFEEITLGSQEDIQTLISLVRCWNNCSARYMKYITISIHPRYTRYWIHVISSLLLPRLETLCYVHMSTSSAVRIGGTSPPHLATTLDIPIELYDLILNFFSLHASIARAKYNYVAVSKKELGQIALVCRRWADLLRPHIFKYITLRTRNDVDTFLSVLNSYPKTSIVDYIQFVGLSLSVTTYPFEPWIHTISRLLPILRIGTRPESLRIEGPLPPGQFMSSIHGVLPRHSPQLASAITLIDLTNVHFKQFDHLVRLLKYMPVLVSVKCKQVTWEHRANVAKTAATAYLSRRTSNRVEYTMRGCTDDGAVGRLSSLLGHTRLDILEQSHADALYSITSALGRHSSSTAVDQGMRSTREGDKLSLASYLPFGPRIGATLHVYLTPSMQGQRRRIRVVVVDCAPSGEPVVLEASDWAAIDEHVATLRGLESVLFSFANDSELLRFRNEVLIPHMPRLSRLPNLRWVISVPDLRESIEGDILKTIRVSCTEDTVCHIEQPVKRKYYSWEQFL